MWNRKELKAKGKAAFRANYWKCVIVALILAALIGGAASSAAGTQSGRDTASAEVTLQETMENLTTEEQSIAIAIISGTLAVVVVVSFAMKVLVFNPLKVGANLFFYRNSDAPAQLGEILYGFKNGYGRVVAAMFLRDLFIGLWSLLFVIPGFVKAISYSLTPYILADYPDMSATEAITLSRKMMNGHKMNVFVLYLSFFGWEILSAVTCGLVGVFWVNPWMNATDAELYKAIKAEYRPVE